MRSILLTSLTIAISITTATPAFSTTETKTTSSGIFSSIGSTIDSALTYVGKFFSKSESYGNIEKEKKDSSELIRKEATVSEELHFKAAGPRIKETPKPSVDLNEVEDKIAPFPAQEEPSAPDNSKNLPIRKKIANVAALENLQNESTLVEEIEKKIADEMPQAKLANTLSTEKDASAPTMNTLEAEFSSGNPPPVHDGLNK